MELVQDVGATERDQTAGVAEVGEVFTSSPAARPVSLRDSINDPPCREDVVEFGLKCIDERFCFSRA